MRRLLIGLLVALGLTTLVWSQERVDLTTPETKPANTSYTVARLDLDWATPRVYVYLLGVNGEPKLFVYTESEARALMVALNKANLSTRSLHQRVLDRLVADGKIDGTVAGSVP